MRLIVCALLVCPLHAFAETLTLPSKATSAIVYSQGALVTHDVSVTLPAGSHEIVMPSLPQDATLEGLRVAAPDMKIGAIRYRDDITPPQDIQDTPEITAAKAKIDQIKDRIQTVEDSAAREQLAVEAATAQINFLAWLGQSETLPRDTDSLRGIGEMIGADTLAARQAAFDAELRVRGIREQLEDLQKDLAKAQQALDALVPEGQDRPLLVMDVIAEAPVNDMPMAVSFFTGAVSWSPTYDLRLSDGDTPKLEIERGAEVQQFTQENWEGIQLSVSTRSPSAQTDPNQLPLDLRSIRNQGKYNAVTSRAAPAPRVMAEADLAEEGAANFEPTVNFQGLSVTYEFAQPVDVATGADQIRLPFDTVSFEADLVARAVPLQHDTAFLVAKVTNTTGEPLLSTPAAVRFFDGVLVGGSYLPAIEAGQEAEIGFGPIEGLQLTRKLLKRDAGDRGIITRSNEQTEEIEITAKNLTGRTWQVELRDRVPYSEQEDLEITFRASPDPDVTGVDDRRGILQWNIEMVPGNSATITTSHRITWPEGEVLQ